MSDPSPIYPSSKTPGIRESVFWGKISPFQAPFPFPIYRSIPENLIKPLFSVPVENKPYNRPVWQNTADLHLTYWLVRPFKSSCFLPHSLGHKILEMPPEHQYEGHFFWRRSEKMGFYPWKRGAGHGAMQFMRFGRRWTILPEWSTPWVFRSGLWNISHLSLS